LDWERTERGGNKNSKQKNEQGRGGQVGEEKVAARLLGMLAQRTANIAATIRRTIYWNEGGRGRNKRRVCGESLTGKKITDSAYVIFSVQGRGLIIVEEKNKGEEVGKKKSPWGKGKVGPLRKSKTEGLVAYGVRFRQCFHEKFILKQRKEEKKKKTDG